MSAPSVPLSSWVESFTAAIDEVTGPSGGFATAAGAPLRVESWGGYISLISESGSVRLGVSASRGGCQRLARGLLGLEEDVQLPNADVADALCEMLNIVAGVVKRQLQPVAGPLKIGLPVFLTEAPRTTTAFEVSIKVGAIGATSVSLVVMSLNNATARAPAPV